MKFSVIVPTYNEELDIKRTLSALETVVYAHYEVIVVDDASTDRTLPIVQGFTQRLPHFRLLIQPTNQGVATARNRGIKEAQGEVVIILNADVLLPNDFLTRIEPYYREGKAWVAVLSRVENQETCYSRYTEAESYYEIHVKKAPWVWSEGFSCTKEAAMQVGLFPEEMPGCSGEDVDFGLNLEKRFPGVRATEIVVPHIAPDQLTSYWQQQKGRGKGRTNYYHFIKGYRGNRLIMNSLFSSLWRLLKIGIGVPLYSAWRLSGHTRKGRKDFVPFIWVSVVKEMANLVGIWSAYRRLGKSQEERKRRA